MKRWIKAALRPIWRATLPVRRILMRKLEIQMSRVNENIVQQQILPRLNEGFESTANASHLAAHALSADLNLVLNSVVREISRLQMQVEVLQQIVEDQSRPRNGLFIAGEAEDDHDSRRADDRMKFG